jgi:hypothetical protein
MAPLLLPLPPVFAVHCDSRGCWSVYARCESSRCGVRRIAMLSPFDEERPRTVTPFPSCCGILAHVIEEMTAC